ncbi:hypothetical protein vseg_013953 [Gypsophila vaccaria]
MGKSEDDEFPIESIETTIESNRRSSGGVISGCNCSNLISLIRVIKLNCVLAILLGISVFISAIFWLPPFLKLSNHGDKDLESICKGHAIVASFELQKPVSFVKNVAQLEADIYYELESANAKVVIISLEGAGLNSTYVVFAIDSLSKRSKISEFQLSLIQPIFGSFVTKQAKFRLTTSLFGEPSSFEVLKFPGGFTIVPRENVYPLQSDQISFNFTLNNSIHQIQQNVNALYDQLNAGLHLTQQEILYLRLTNSRGSTVTPPVTVQTSVVLKVGVPSMPRMKELAKTIKDSPSRNLGLNNTVFGKVKQVSLSSILPAGGACSPAPAPGPIHHFHHNHHHHHHHHGYDSYPPATAPSHPPQRTPKPVNSAPAPRRSYHAVPPVAPVSPKGYHGAPIPVKSYHANPPDLRSRFKGKHPGKSPKHSPTYVAVAPSISHHRPSVALPHRQAKPPTPVLHQIAPSSHFPYVIYAHAPPPPPRSEMSTPKASDRTSPAEPLSSSGDRIMAGRLTLALLVALTLGLQ